ncbi:MAG: nuclear transport factor 2 family protein [Conexibacter sp.]
MSNVDRTQLARQFFERFAAGDRDAIERLLAADFTFSSPADPKLDRAGWFERCWPAAGGGQHFRFERIIESGAEVVVTYELKRPDGSGGFNTEVLTFDGPRVRRSEVYFGWDLD